MKRAPATKTDGFRVGERAVDVQLPHEERELVHRVALEDGRCFLVRDLWPRRGPVCVFNGRGVGVSGTAEQIGARYLKEGSTIGCGIKSPSSVAAARIGPRENYASSNIHIAPEMMWQSVPAPGIKLRFECLNEIEYCFGNCFPVTLPIQPLSTVEVRQRRRGRLHLERSNSPKRR
ncbi:hypothetical protein K438DRAFT_1791464 [Mycena galopus ATCC 62051]|nr:hypothetical protein K438DRAFT_1791464 [Mycena galopus ATCC 62051]